MKDPGLQPERTALSWSRTGLLALLVAALLGRAGTPAASVIELALILLLVPTAGLLLYRGSRIPGDGNAEHDDVAERRSVLLFVSLGIATLAILHGITTLGRIVMYLQDHETISVHEMGDHTMFEREVRFRLVDGPNSIARPALATAEFSLSRR